ncbi:MULTISPECIES: hypothetical protein [unclassified Breznakia]|nr:MULTISPECIES: hypothetical protein [unclassified Breznakia]MDH6366810.1 hypothetical protein [Breznakia sp. PH1-1]MDH6403988.1 hypothetical protein [Breznakia sp. PF1-11]MDH6411790.1 hypothetical protein [Breznakia sp. PFB1-11]MDH6413976.1 hypothetical protein [Breznakia sp. PFB1-14]MDH6416406.1 hypothetical protein [Breznakia sp. PFB1-4]
MIDVNKVKHGYIEKVVLISLMMKQTKQYEVKLQQAQEEYGQLMEQVR